MATSTKDYRPTDNTKPSISDLFTLNFLHQYTLFPAERDVKPARQLKHYGVLIGSLLYISMGAWSSTILIFRGSGALDFLRIVGNALIAWVMAWALVVYRESDPSGDERSRKTKEVVEESSWKQKLFPRWLWHVSAGVNVAAIAVYSLCTVRMAMPVVSAREFAQNFGPQAFIYFVAFGFTAED